jgi:hypothetical protein
MMSSAVRAVRAVAAVSVLVVAAGCGGSDDGGDGDFAHLSGDKIAGLAKADMKSLDDVRYTGEITSGSQDVTLDLQAKSSGDCTGSIGIGDGTAQVRSKDGTSWFKPDEAFWRANAGDSADAIIRAVGDKWVLDTEANFSKFCDLDSLFDALFTESGAGAYKTTGTGEVDGQKVVKVEQTGDTGTATGYVLVSGKHYLVKLERTNGDRPGHLEFTDFDKDFDVTAPAKDEVIDLSSA